MVELEYITVAEAAKRVQSGGGEFGEQIRRDILTNLGDTLTCRRCGKPFVKDTWNFYGLCDSCFTSWNVFRMEHGKYGVSCNEWIEETKNANHS